MARASTAHRVQIILSSPGIRCHEWPLELTHDGTIAVGITSCRRTGPGSTPAFAAVVERPQ
jgi:hypothetical protein